MSSALSDSDTEKAGLKDRAKGTVAIGYESISRWEEDTFKAFVALTDFLRFTRPPRPKSYLAWTVPYQKISSWVHECKGHDKWYLADDQSLTRLRLIDCTGTPPRIVVAPEGCTYVALSYIWGGSKEVHFQVGDKITKNIPRTIKDSIKVTR